MSKGMRTIILGGAIGLAGSLGVTLSVASLLPTQTLTRQPATIAPASLRGADLERTLGFYKAVFRGLLDEAYPVTKAYADWHLYALFWRDDKVALYAPRSENRAIGLFTWSAADRTAERVGPCSKAIDVRRAYRNRLRVFSYQGRIRAFRAGTITFVLDPAGKRVRLVQVSTRELSPLAGVELQVTCSRERDR